MAALAPTSPGASGRWSCGSSWTPWVGRRGDGRPSWSWRVGWGVVRLLGVDLTLKPGAAMTRVDGVDALVAGLAAWAVHALLARWRRARWWPFVGSTGLAVSIIGPSYLAAGISAVALIGLHVLVGVVLTLGFAWFVPEPHRGAGRVAGHPQYHG